MYADASEGLPRRAVGEKKYLALGCVIAAMSFTIRARTHWTTLP